MQILKSIFFLIVSVSLFLIFSVNLWNEASFFLKAQRTFGEIVNANGATNRYMITFTDSSGIQRYITKIIGGSNLETVDYALYSYKNTENVGESIELLYDKANPQHAEILTPSYFITYFISISALLIFSGLAWFHAKYLITLKT